MRSMQAAALAFVLLISAGTGGLAGQTLPAGPQVLTFFSEVDDTEQPYGLYLPPRFDTARRYPLVIMLHGAGSNHRLALRRVFGRSNQDGENDVEASRSFPEWRDVDFIVASPFARGTMGYQGVAETDVYDVVADVKRRFPIDEDRVYLTGLSMGGGGTLWIGLTRPDVWAAIAPVCPAPPEGTAELAPNALHLPVHLFQGADDPVVRAETVREWATRFEAGGTKVEYTEYPGVGHNSWENAYAEGAIFEWFSQFRRSRHPDHVRFRSGSYKYDRAYWVRLDELTPGVLAGIDARFTGPNRIEIVTSALEAFTLDLKGHPRVTAGRPLEAVVDRQAVRVRAADALSFSRRDGRWTPARAQPAAPAKRPGAEGPIGEAVAGRHIYVYGTAGDPSSAELQARQADALRAAEWSVYRGPFLGRVMVFPRIVADKDVRPSDLESANLVLFGTRETNALIERFADRLPLHLDGGAGEYGLIYVFPVGGRYVLVSSGLPWWTGDSGGGIGAAPSSRPGLRFAGGPAGLLSTFPDYLLFRNALGNLVVEGRFDREWRMPEADAAKMRETGAIRVGVPVAAR